MTRTLLYALALVALLWIVGQFVPEVGNVAWMPF